jgi:hypothetical protein
LIISTLTYYPKEEADKTGVDKREK